MSEQNATNTKFRLVFLPYLTISAIITVGCSLFTLIYIYTGAGFIKEEDIYMIVPLISAIPATLMLYPLFKLFVNRRKSSATMVFIMFSIIGMGLQSGTVQYFLLKVAGKQVQVHNVQDVLENSNARFFKIESAHADTHNVCVFDTILYGKSNATFRVAIGTQLYNSPADTTGKTKTVWMANTYVLGTYARQGGSTYDNMALSRYSNESLASFQQTDMKHITYFTRVLYSNAWLNIASALTRCGDEPRGALFLTPQSEPYENRAGNSFWWALAAWAGGCFLIFFLLNFSYLDEEKLAAYQQGHVTGFNDDVVKAVKFIVHYLTPREGYFLTPIFINIKIVIFITLCFLGVDALNNHPSNLLDWGANYAPLTLHGQWWRVVTSLFIEVNAFTLALNMVSLACIGFALEPVLGRTRLVTGFLIAGIVGNVTSVIWHSAFISAGSLGAILGLHGIFLILVCLKFFSWKMNKAVPMVSAVWLMSTFLSGLRIVWFDNVGDLGGLASGIILGLIFYTSLPKHEKPLE